MSAELWLKQIQVKDQQIRLLRAQLASKESHILYLEGVDNTRKRKTYSKKHPRENGDKGRVMLDCRDCEKYRPQHAHRLCRKCYDKRRYANRGDGKLGGKRLTQKERLKIQTNTGDRSRKARQTFEDRIITDSMRRKGFIPE